MESREEKADGRSLSWTTGLTLGEKLGCQDGSVIGHEVLGAKLGEENEVGSPSCGERVGVVVCNEGDWARDVGCAVTNSEGSRVGEQTLLDGCDESSLVGEAEVNAEG
eukprot:scaffold7917_cov237-Ochromonas_danica.AAC.1